MEPSSPSNKKMTDEKKDEDMSSLDDVLWSENPEKAYFQSMMHEQQMGRIADGKDMDDSIIGNETLASLMEEGNHAKKKNEDLTKYVPDSDGDSLNTNPKAPFQMAIVGLEDDLSTIANDSVAGKAMDSHLVAQGDHAKITQRDFKEYTPERKKRSDSDEATAPETPPGMIRVSSTDEDSKGKSKSSGDPKKQKGAAAGLIYGISPRSKRIYIGALIIACLLLASVIGLAIALSQLRSEDEPQPNDGLDYPEGFITAPPIELARPVFSPVAAPESVPNPPPESSPVSPPVSTPTATDTPASPVDAPTPPPVSGPVAPAPTRAPADAPIAITPSPTKLPTNSPTGSPTRAPVPPTDPPTAAPNTDTPTYPPGPEDDLITLLASRANTTSILEAFEDRDSPQYLSFRWVASDPRYYEYGPDRAVQRFVLGVVGLTLRDSPRKRNLQGRIEVGSSASLLSDWLTDTDECTWFSSRRRDFCNNDGLYTHLELRNSDLFGTIPMEISLLSNSLENLNLSGNHLYGSIPAELAKLSYLTRLHITSNTLDGTIPTQLGELTNLVLLGLGRNNLSGTLPTEIGLLEDLRTLDAASNNITGTIPPEYGNLRRLDTITLNENRLTGTIPNEFGQLNQLEKLELAFNMLTGEMPNRICNLRNLESLGADCLLVECDCCTTCGNRFAAVPTEMPSAFPTSGPTPPTPQPTRLPTGNPTPAPVRLPTEAPTPEPTQCESNIDVQSGCFAQGDPIPITFINCDPNPDDWIGIYPSWVNPNNLGLSPVLWVWTCGSQGCRGEVKNGSIVLTEEHIGEGSNAQWPLERDDYRAFLIRRNPGGPYAAHASSNRFEIERDSC